MIRSFSFLIAALLSLSGCISLLPDSGDLPPRLALDPGLPLTDDTEPKYQATLVIEDPDAAAVYNTFFVAIANSPLEYEYLADAQWTDRVPVLIRRFLVRRFDNRHLFVAVADRTNIALSDYSVQADIRAFHLDTSAGQEVVRASIGVLLLDRGGNVVGTEVFTHVSQPAGTERGDRARALNGAAQVIADEMIDWVDEKVAQRIAE